MPSFLTTLLILTTILVVLPGAFAFGAGDIPDFAYLQDKAFRHGDIENILETLAKSAAQSFGGGGGLLGNVMGVLASAAAGGTGPKFSKMDIKRVYFGNWLRDYSQAMDIAGLSKLSADNLIVVVSVLAFMTFGYATEEFQVTADRLGVYLPVEHIDNPKGYAEKEGDARKFHPKLRGPIDNRELEIDENNGMKKYIATDNQGWDTSAAHIRRSLEGSIQKAREAQNQENANLWEAYRLLGSALHTLEDLLAHSNWCELALRKLGHSEVFCYVGDNVLVNTPNGQAPPLVTGTFGSADFMHSMLGESVDHLSESSLNDLSKKMDEAKKKESGDSPLKTLRLILSQLPSSQGNDEKVQQAEQMQAASLSIPDRVGNVDIKEVQQRLWEVLVWRDGVMRDVGKTIENIPGLDQLLEQLVEALNVYIYTVLEPYLTPILTEATGALRQGSKAVIDSDDQYQVFNDANCSDPSHSMLAKDHFDNILNEPAGKVAQVVVEHTVNAVVQAWGSQEDPGAVVNKVLEAIHHPYYARGDSQVQTAMFQRLQEWFNGLGGNQNTTLEVLTKDSVKDGRNKRLGEDGQARGGGGGGHSHGQSTTNPSSGRTQYNTGGQQGGGYVTSTGGYGQGSGQQGGYNTSTGGYGQGAGNDEEGSYNSRTHQYESGGGSGRGEHGSSGGYGGNNEGRYGSQTNQYGSGGYRGGNEDYNSGTRQTDSYGGYGGSRRDNRRDESSGYGSRRDNNEGDSYNSRAHQYESSGYGSRRDNDEGDSYNSRAHQHESSGYGGRRGGGEEEGSYNSRTEQHGSSGYGGRSSGREEDDSYNSRRGGYERSGQGGDETYGAERLNINDEQRGGYGGGGYGGGGYGEGGRGYGSRRDDNEY